MSLINSTVDRFQVLPFYIICDTSTSMIGAPIDAVNSELPKIHKAIAEDPTVNDKCRLSIIGFNTRPKVELQLQQLSKVREMPILTARGRTNFGVLFKELEQIIKKDLNEIRQFGNAVLRPIVFFISDGGATDPWVRTFDRFSDKSQNPEAPILISFGVGKANEKSIKRVGVHRAMMAEKTESVPNALRNVLKSLTGSILGSSRHAEPQIVLPEPDSTMRILDRS